MSRTAHVMLAALLVAVAYGDGTAAASDDDRATPTWAELLLDESSTADQRTRALEAVKVIAAGDPSDEETREAIFALAGYWRGRSDEGLGLEATQAINTATALYLDDPRTPALLRVLADALIRRNDPYGAHTAFRRMIGNGMVQDDPGLLARAASNAARAGDMAAAFDWASRVDADAVGSRERTQLLLARTTAAQALGRSEIALAAVELLLVEAAEELHADERALLAAADALESVGMLEPAIPLYYRFISVHPHSHRRAYAMFMLGSLYERTGKIEPALAHWSWLLEAYPDSREAHEARMRTLAIERDGGERAPADQHLDVIRTAHTTTRGIEACDTFVQRFVGAGRPLEVAEALLDAATPNPRRPLDGLGRALIHHCLERSLTQVLGLLDARGDLVSIAAIAARAAALDVNPPEQLRPVVEDARRALGLPASGAGPLREAIVDARAAMSESRWDDALSLLERGHALDRAAPVETRAEAERLKIELLWRAERSDEALELAAAAVGRPSPDPLRRRALHVLIADINFADGRTELGCEEYRRAAALASSRWVEAQLVRCAASGRIAGASR